MFKCTLISSALLAIIFSMPANAGLTFEQYWADVKAQNPMLKEQAELTKSIEKRPALEIPMPEVAISEMNEKLPFTSSMGKMQRTVELSQTIPFISKFSKAREIKESNVLASTEKEALTMKSLKAEAFQAFLMYAKTLEMKKILTEKEALFLAHQSRSKALLVSDQAYQTYLYDLELEISMVKSEIKMADIELASGQAMLKRIRSTEGDGDTFLAPELAPLAPPPSFSLADLSEHPMQKMNHYEIQSMNRDLEMAKLDWAPDLMLKLRDIKSYDPMISAGKEIMIGISLPFAFPWQRSGNIESIAHKKRSEEFRGQQIKLQLNEEYSTLSNQLKEQWSLLSIYKEKSLPVTGRKLKLARNLTRLDMESLEIYERAIDQLTNLKLKILEEEFKYRLSIFKLQELVTTEGKI